MYKYQNNSPMTQTITASGVIEPRVVNPNETFISDAPIENPNFEFLGEVDVPEDMKNSPLVVSKVTGVSPQQPNKVTEADKIETKETN